MQIKLFKDKKGAFRDFTRSLTVGNIFFFIIIGMFLVYVVSLILSQMFKTPVIKIGTPFKFLIVIIGLVMAFYIVSRRQGGLDRNDILAIGLIIVGLAALFYYGPKLLPDILGNSILLQSPLGSSNSAFTTVYNVSATIHDAIQTVVPIP